MRFFAKSLAIACLLAGFAVLNALPIYAAPLGFSKAYSPSTVDPGGLSRVTYTIDNAANQGEVGSLAFIDFVTGRRGRGRVLPSDDNGLREQCGIEINEQPKQSQSHIDVVRGKRCGRRNLHD